MPYANEAVSREHANTSVTSLLKDTEILCERLFSIRDQLRSLGEALYGVSPREAEKGDAPSPSNIRLHIDSAFKLAGQIDDEIGRIGSRL